MGCGPSKQDKKTPLRPPQPPMLPNDMTRSQNILNDNKSTMTFKIDEPSTINMNAVSHDVNGWVMNKQQPLLLPVPQNVPVVPQLMQSNYATVEIEAPPQDVFNTTMVGAPLSMQSAKLITRIVYEN